LSEEVLISEGLRQRGQQTWPTPKASAAGPDFAKMDRSATGISLQTAVAMFPTPKSRDGKGQSQRGIHAPGDALPNMDNGTGVPIGGSLNPQFVAWLMCWPLNWTSMEPLPPATWAAWQRAFRTESIS
jgi:hypothetical protein